MSFALSLCWWDLCWWEVADCEKVARGWSVSSKQESFYQPTNLALTVPMLESCMATGSFSKLGKGLLRQNKLKWCSVFPCLGFQLHDVNQAIRRLKEMLMLNKIAEGTIRPAWNRKLRVHAIKLWLCTVEEVTSQLQKDRKYRFWFGNNVVAIVWQ